MATAIEFNHVGKQYRLGLVSTRTLSHDLNRWWQTSVRGKEDPYLKIGETNDRSIAGNSDYVWALQDIDFKVEQGDVVGIIGKNGAGKSTLLKLLSKVTGPTTGTIRARGRIGALLEVGTGFHPEMTGRENIYMNGAIMGMTKNDISRRLDEIVAFSGCERYIDTPVKRYSSGMTVRLGFAVAAHLEPDILVVDEVLAVGDAEFQKKAIGKMQSISQGDGRTVLFVSHNMASIKALCQSGVLLENGTIKQIGEISEIVESYIGSSISNLVDYIKITDSNRNTGLLRELEYLSIQMLNDVQNVSTDEPLDFVALIKRNNPSIDVCQFGVVFHNVQNVTIGALYTEPVKLPKNSQLFKVHISIPHHQLSKGRYSLNFNISQNDYTARIRDYDIVYDVISFEVNYLDCKHQIPFVEWTNKGSITFRNAVTQIEPFLE